MYCSTSQEHHTNAQISENSIAQLGWAVSISMQSRWNAMQSGNYNKIVTRMFLLWVHVLSTPLGYLCANSAMCAIFAGFSLLFSLSRCIVMRNNRVAPQKRPARGHPRNGPWTRMCSVLHIFVVNTHSVLIRYSLNLSWRKDYYVSIPWRSESIFFLLCLV